jgi:hypothetical protein
MSRYTAPFGLIVLAQAAHSVEEYIGRLWETFPAARFLTGIVSSDPERGFLVINVGLVAFGVWCLIWPVRRDWRTATSLAWIWVVLECVNGAGHVLWSLGTRGYAPGVATAPLLLAVALHLARQLRTIPSDASAHV